MKLLLTSFGISNETIRKALLSLLDQPISSVKLGCVPTAINADSGDKGWYIEDLRQLQAAGFEWMDVIDPSAAGVDWRARFDAVDVVFVSGGNTFHLLDQARKTGFADWLGGALKNKLYIGSSAGSILMTPTVAAAGVVDENIPKLEDLRGLHCVDFELLPHVPDYISLETVQKYAKTTTKPLYALDNKSAIQVVDGKVEVVSEGQWRLFNANE